MGFFCGLPKGRKWAALSTVAFEVVRMSVSLWINKLVLSLYISLSGPSYCESIPETWAHFHMIDRTGHVSSQSRLSSVRTSEPHFHSSECLLFLPSWHPFPFFCYSILTFPGNHPSSALRFLPNLNIPVHLNSILEFLSEQNYASEIKLRSFGGHHGATRKKVGLRTKPSQTKKKKKKRIKS